MRRLIVTLAALALLGGCAVGPSTRVSPAGANRSRPGPTPHPGPPRGRSSTPSPSRGRRSGRTRRRARCGRRPRWWWTRPATSPGSRSSATPNWWRWSAPPSPTTATSRWRGPGCGSTARGSAWPGRTSFPGSTSTAAVSTNKVTLGGSDPMQFDAVRATADLSWELDFWGRLRRQTEAAAFDWRGREADVRATVVTLVGDVATAYLELRELDENLSLTEQTLTSRRATLDLARRRFAQGLISELDVRQFEADVADPAARVADFARQRTEKENQLALLLGKPPGSHPARPATGRGGAGDHGAGLDPRRAHRPAPGRAAGAARLAGGHRPDRGGGRQPAAADHHHRAVRHPAAGLQAALRLSRRRSTPRRPGSRFRSSPAASCATSSGRRGPARTRPRASTSRPSSPRWARRATRSPGCGSIGTRSWPRRRRRRRCGGRTTWRSNGTGAGSPAISRSSTRNGVCSTPSSRSGRCSGNTWSPRCSSIGRWGVAGTRQVPARTEGDQVTDHVRQEGTR